MSPAITAVKGGLLHLQYIKFLSSKVIYQHQDMAKSLEALFFPDSNLTKNRQKDYKIVFDSKTYASYNPVDENNEYQPCIKVSYFRVDRRSL